MLTLVVTLTAFWLYTLHFNQNSTHDADSDCSCGCKRAAGCSLTGHSDTYCYKYASCRGSHQSQSMIIGSLPRSDALRYRCHTILSLQRIMAQLHAKAADHMPPQAQLQLLAVLQVWHCHHQLQATAR